MYLSNKITEEGAGAQYQRAIGLYAICKKNDNLKYIHNKITVGHNYDNDEHWDDKWDHFFGLSEISCKEEIDKDIEVEETFYLNDDHCNQLHLNKIVKTFLPYNITEQNIDNFFDSDCLGELRNIYSRNNADRKLFLFDNDSVNIAIHIRVSNEYDDVDEIKLFSQNRTDGRFCGQDTYLLMIQKLKLQYPSSKIHIFTQSNFYQRHSSLIDLQDVIIHTDVNAIDSFHHMSNADVFVMSKSSFSYVAGLYNTKTVIYMPFWHQPLSSWQIFNSE